MECGSEIKQTKQIANKVRPAQRPRMALTRLAVRSPSKGRERSGGTATSWQCKDNELVPDDDEEDEDEDEARQRVQVKCQSKATMKDTGAGGGSGKF